MKRKSTWSAIMAMIVVAAMVSLGNPAFAAGKQTLTGEVGDAMCGRNHMEGASAAECTRSCVARGSKYALVVGDKVYVLNTSDKAAMATLDKQAGKQAAVTGIVTEDSIDVSSVVAK